MNWDEFKNILGADSCEQLRLFLVQLGIVDPVDRQLIIDRVRALVREEVRRAVAQATRQSQN
jgi:hypothetical protein